MDNFNLFDLFDNDIEVKKDKKLDEGKTTDAKEVVNNAIDASKDSEQTNTTEDIKDKVKENDTNIKETSKEEPTSDAKKEKKTKKTKKVEDPYKELKEKCKKYNKLVLKVYAEFIEEFTDKQFIENIDFEQIRKEYVVPTNPEFGSKTKWHIAPMPNNKECAYIIPISPFYAKG